jgi:hypothetical protein
VSDPTTYRDHGAAGPEADLPVWDDTTDHGRITQAAARDGVADRRQGRSRVADAGAFPPDTGR